MGAHAPRTPAAVARPSGRCFAYLAAACGVTVYGRLSGHATLNLFASSPDDVALGRLSSLLGSFFLVQGPPVVQLVATAVLGVAAIRLAGAAVFWVATLLANIPGTLLVYAGVWIANIVSPASAARLASERDFGVSLVWCAALGVLAVAGWWRPWPALRWFRYLLQAGPVAAIAVVMLLSDGLSIYEHAVAFGLAAAVALLGRRWGLAR